MRFLSDRQRPRNGSNRLLSISSLFSPLSISPGYFTTYKRTSNAMKVDRNNSFSLESCLQAGHAMGVCGTVAKSLFFHYAGRSFSATLHACSFFKLGYIAMPLQPQCFAVTTRVRCFVPRVCLAHTGSSLLLTNFV